MLNACSSSYGQSPGIGWPYYFSAASARVLAQAVPLLLLTVMFGSMTFLKSTFLRVVVPFEESVILHLHAAAIFGAMVVMHLVATVFNGYTPYDLWWYISGFLGFGCGLIAIFAGLAYWIATHTSYWSTFRSFPLFIWVHRFGYLMICVAYPIHIWPTVQTNPLSYILTYMVFLGFLLEILWRTFHLSRSAECRIQKISPEFYWLEISTRSKKGAYLSGQWVYLTIPGIAVLERHPFTIAQVFDGRREQLPELASAENASESGGSDVDALLLNSGGQPEAFAGPACNLRFLIKRCSDRGERSWTNRLYESLEAGETMNVYVDGPFASPASNITVNSVKRALLIGVGSGITAPLGIAAGRPQCWTTLVFVGREASAVCQVVAAIRGIVHNNPDCLRGGARLFLTAKGFTWPDELLLSGLNKMLNFAEGWTSGMERAYAEYLELSRWMFHDNLEQAPELEGKSKEQLRAFYLALKDWRIVNRFSQPLVNVSIEFGRPDWQAVLDERQSIACEAPDTLSFVPEVLKVGSLLEGSTLLVELHTLYCGPRNALKSIEQYVTENNKSLYGNAGGERMHLMLHREVFG